MDKISVSTWAKLHVQIHVHNRACYLICYMKYNFKINLHVIIIIHTFFVHVHDRACYMLCGV